MARSATKVVTNLLQRKHLRWGPFLSVDVSEAYRKGCVLQNSDDILNHESVLMLYVSVSLALGVRQYLYSALV